MSATHIERASGAVTPVYFAIMSCFIEWVWRNLIGKSKSWAILLSGEFSWRDAIPDERNLQEELLACLMHWA